MWTITLCNLCENLCALCGKKGDAPNSGGFYIFVSIRTKWHEKKLCKTPGSSGSKHSKIQIHHLSQADVAISLQEKQGRPVSQEFVSDLENKETIEDEALLKQIAEILKVDPEVIKNLDLESALNIIANNIHAVHLNCKGVVHSQAAYVHSQTNNPLDTIVEMFEKQTAELKEEIERLKKRNS